MITLISIARRASAFRTASGVFYALFETTYPKGEADPQPRAQCVAFGTIEHITRWIFSAMAACEAGLLQGAQGAFHPSDYYRFWQHALRRPDRLFTQPIWIKASRGHEATIPTRSDIAYDGNCLPFAVRTLNRHGYVELAAMVGRGEEVILDLHRDAAVLADIYGGVSGKRIEPWRIIQPHGKGEGDPSLASPPRPAAKTVPQMRIFHLDHPTRVCALIQGQRSMIGTRDELLHDFICHVAPVLELAAADAGVKAIHAFRNTLDRHARVAPSSLKVVIDKACLLNMVLWRSRYEDIEAALGDRARPVDFGFETTIDDLRTTRQLPLLAELPSISLEFVAAYAREPQTTSSNLAHTH